MAFGDVTKRQRVVDRLPGRGLYGIPTPEIGECLSQRIGILDKHEMRRTFHDDALAVRKPFEKQPVYLAESGPNRLALATENRHGGLIDLARFPFAEGPSL